MFGILFGLRGKKDFTDRLRIVQSTSDLVNGSLFSSREKHRLRRYNDPIETLGE